MSLLCILGAHRPALTTVTRKAAGLGALCERCGLPLERPPTGRWAPAPPLATRLAEDRGAARA
jgi:hypothetical protein